MRKLSKALPTASSGRALADEDSGMRPRRVQGATITAWHGTPEIDLTALFARPAPFGTIAGSAAGGDRQTVSLSDGTEITFATSSECDAIAHV